VEAVHNFHFGYSTNRFGTLFKIKNGGRKRVERAYLQFLMTQFFVKEYHDCYRSTPQIE
jgi:hypothetical protein